MNEQKNRSKLDNKNNNVEWINVKEKYSKNDGFVGYDNYEYNSYIVKYRKIEDYFEVVFNETPFYGESGGQIGDIGEIIDENNNKIEVFDTKKINNEIVHYLRTLPNNLNTNFLLKINKEKEIILVNITHVHIYYIQFYVLNLEKIFVRWVLKYMTTNYVLTLILVEILLKKRY